MSINQPRENNVVQLRTAAQEAREEARQRTRSVELEMRENADQFDVVMKAAARAAASNGSHIFAEYNIVLRAAERSLAEVEQQLEVTKALAAKQLEEIDCVKSKHEDFVKMVRVRTNSDQDYQQELSKSLFIGDEILSLEKELKLAQDKRVIRSKIMKLESPVVWALYENGSIASKPGRHPVANMLSRMGSWFRGSHRFKQKTASIEDLDAQISYLEGSLSQLSADLSQAHENIFAVRDANLDEISESFSAVETAQKSFIAAKARQDVNTIDLCIKRQNLLNLRNFDHPIAEHALQSFADIAISASRSNKPDPLVFLLGSKRLADNLVEAVKAWDNREYSLQAELHYNQEDERDAERKLEAEAVFSSEAR
jgi:uncharacterized protein YbcI